MSAPTRTRSHARPAGESSNSERAQATAAFGAMPTPKQLRYFEPSAATASMFLYAQGAAIVCCHHDTLTIERRFAKHSEEIQLLAVDNQSDKGAGRLVVSYDAGQTAIVWDLMTGDEVSRFSSYEDLTVAAWMRSGNVAFGNTQGNIIMFEPTTSEHISTRTLDQIAVTALAPSADCRTFAIGYQNGSLLIATLQPRFTILHQLQTPSRAPSPVVTLSWHASSSRQRSDMLAVQAHDGDLRVWSVAKSSSADDAAKVVRLLKRADDLTTGANWMGWSKNGRIIQFTDSQTHSWDVRTKHVTCDSIPTLEHVKGLAVYGPGATLFTLGPNGTVQQFDLNSPSIMVANVQHPVNPLPPSPPNSIEEPGVKSAHSATTINTSASESELSSIPVGETISESDEDHLSPFQRITRHQDVREPSSGTDASNEIIDSPASSRSGLSSLSRSSAGSGTPRRHPNSAISRGMSDHTYISAGSSIRTSTVGRKDLETMSMGYTMPSTSYASQSSTRSRQRPSRLRNEIPRSPDDNKVHDLFMYTRARLTDIPYKHPATSDFSRLTNDDLRRQMLSTIFGWHKEVDDLIRDEMSRHPVGSTTRILLAKWLGDIDADAMVADSKNMSSSDWMLLALSGIGGQASQHKLGRTYVSRLLESGDIHAAVTIMLGMGDFNDAIEAYMAHKRYMEALILVCLEFPSVWERQAAIVRKWGEWAIQHNRQQLAIRCFACTDKESTEPWTSPSAQQLNFKNLNASIPEILSPPLSPPGVQRGPQRSIAKSSALKLITSFGDQTKKSKFYSQADGGQTPLAAGVTPIAESAVSPGGFEAATAFLRPSNNSRFNTPTSATAGGPRGRLPSIGEIPSDLNREALKTGSTQRSEHRRGHGRRASSGQDNLTEGLSLQRAATASPMMMRDTSQPIVIRAANQGGVLPSPDKHVMAMMEKGDFARRNGSRDRMPQGLHLELRQEDDTEIISPEQSVSSSTRFHWPSRRRGAGSVSSSVTTSSAGRSLRGRGRPGDDYIHSLDAAKSSRKGQSSRERAHEPIGARQASQERRGAKSREASQDRGRPAARMWHKPKRSPTSPVPMSPEDIANLSNPLFNDSNEPRTVRKSSVVKKKVGSRTSSRGSRRQSPDPRPAPLDLRGRSKEPEGSSRRRSPSSPLPMSAPPVHYEGSEDEDDLKKAVEAREEFRNKHSRSATRGLNSPMVSKLDHSQAREKDAAEAIEVLPPILGTHSRHASTDQAGDLRRMKEERLRKKEQAARELEERRQSLAQRGHATPLPTPYQPNLAPLDVGVETSNPDKNSDMPPRSATTSPPRSMYARGGPQLGLPATPKAMRLIIEGDPNGRISQAMPEVPSIPAQYIKLPTTPHGPPAETATKAQGEPEMLTLLPSTVYQPPVRPPPRSMSAPIPEDSRQVRTGRKASAGDTKTIAEKTSDDERMPPPPPPAPPMLKELQHLAAPPPPPPAPLPNAQRSQLNSALSSGMIEIVMDDEEGIAPVAVAAPNDNMVPVLSPPAPPHNRGRSIGDGNGIASTFAKAKDRLRSGSRGRKEPSRNAGKESPYESVPSTQLQPTIRSPPPVMYDQDALRTPIGIDSTLNKHMSTGLHKSEMF